MTLLVLFPRAARTRIVSPRAGRLVPDGWVLQLVAGYKSPLPVLTLERALLTMMLKFASLRELRFERHERFVLVDWFCLQDLESLPGGRLGPLTNKSQIDFVARA